MSAHDSGSSCPKVTPNELHSMHSPPLVVLATVKLVCRECRSNIVPMWGVDLKEAWQEASAFVFLEP